MITKTELTVVIDLRCPGAVGARPRRAIILSLQRDPTALFLPWLVAAHVLG